MPITKFILYHPESESYMYAHTEDAKETLLQSGAPGEIVDVTGNAVHEAAATAAIGPFDPDANEKAVNTANAIDHFLDPNEEGYPLASKLRDSKQMRMLRAILGYVQNGTDTTVKIAQDDATRTFHIQVGGKENYYWDSLYEAILAAYANAPEENK